MPFSTGAKNAMLDSQTLDRAQLHSGAPGAAGTSNALGAKVACAFAAAAGSARALSAGVNFTGLGASQSVTHFSVWDDNGGSPVFKGSGTISSGDVAANAAGEYTLAVGTTVALNDS
jgi:hypothetical protein